MAIIIGVIGGADCSSEIKKLAFEVGCEIARNGALLICGGLSGVMENACKGAKSEGGTTIAVLPGISRYDTNPYVDIPIVTGMGVARNIIIVRSSEAIIAIDGKYGTLSELAFAFSLNTPVIGLKTWDIDAPIKHVQTPKDAVALAIKLSKRSE